MKDFFVPKDLLLFSNNMRMNSDFVVRGFSGGLSEAMAALTATVRKLWTPADITTALWLDVADASTITLVSGAVSQIADKSGNNRHATQGASSQRPVLSGGALSGLDTLLFDGANDYLSLGTQLGKPQNYTIFVVSKPTKALSNNQAIICSMDSGGNSTSAWGSIANLSSQAGKLWWQYGTGSLYRWGFGAGAFTANTWAQHCLRHENGVQDESAYTNGSLLTNGSQAGTATGVEGTAHELSIGRLGALSGHYFGGEIAEIIILLSAASLTDRQKVEGYLAHKWGLTASLPSDHPYKTAAPTI